MHWPRYYVALFVLMVAKMKGGQTYHLKSAVAYFFSLWGPQGVRFKRKPCECIGCQVNWRLYFPALLVLLVLDSAAQFSKFNNLLGHAFEIISSR